MLVCDMQGSQVRGWGGGGGNKTQNYLVPYFIHFYLTHFLFCISGLLTGARREDLLRLQAAKPCPPQLGNAPSRLMGCLLPQLGLRGGRAGAFLGKDIHRRMPHSPWPGCLGSS